MAHDSHPDLDVRPATPDEAADPRGMHEANRVAWEQAAEDYERRLTGSVERIRARRSSLLPVETALIGDLHGRCRHAVHVQCAGGEDTLSLWLAGADRVTGIDFSPRMLALARALADAVEAPAAWVEADVLDLPHELDGKADLVYTGRGSIMWVQDLDAWAAGLARLPRPGGRLVLYEGHPAEWLFDGDGEGGWMLTDYDYFAGARGVARLGARLHRAALGARRRAALEVRPGLDAGRGGHARCWAAASGWSRSPSTPSTGGAATATSIPPSAEGCRCRSP